MKEKIIRGIKKNVFFMGLVSFFTDISSEMILPVLPLFLSNVLHVNMAVIGLIEGIASSVASILKTVSGWLSDKFRKRKIFIVLGYLLSTIVKPFLAIATLWQHVLAVRVLDRIGKGIRTSPRDALIAESSEKRKGAAFGFHRMMDTSGAIVGTLVASYLLFKIANAYRTIFWLAVIPAIIAVFIAIFFVKEIRKKEIKEAEFKFSFKSLDVNYKKFIFIATLFSLGNFSYAFFLLRAQELGIALALIPIVYLVYNISYGISAFPAGKWSDKVGKRKMLVIGYLIFALTCLGFAFTSAAIYAWFLFAFCGVYNAINNVVSRAYVADLVTADKRGTALGIFHTFTGLALFPASFIGGILWNSFSAKITFIYGAVLAFVASFLLWNLLQNDKQ